MRGFAEQSSLINTQSLCTIYSRLFQKIVALDTDEFIHLAQHPFIMEGIFGLASGRKRLWCLIQPLHWLGDLLGQNKLACILSYACRRCMVRFHELNHIILMPDGTKRADAPPVRTAHMHRLAYEYQSQYGDSSYVNAIGAHSYVRPSLLDLGSGSSGVGVASSPEEGFMDGVVLDSMHVGPLGILKRFQECTALCIADNQKRGFGTLAVRLFELRMAQCPSFNDGIRTRRAFIDGYLLNSHLTASDREDLMTLLVAGVGTDNLVFRIEATRIAYLKMLDDITFVYHVAMDLKSTIATLDEMDQANFRCVGSYCLQYRIHESFDHKPTNLILLDLLCSFCTAFKNIFAAYSLFNFNKFHMWQHLGEIIRRWGHLWNYWMQAAELAHKTFLKSNLGASNRTNSTDYFAGLHNVLRC